MSRGYLAISHLPAIQAVLIFLNMFSKQPKFTPKTLPKPKIRTVSIEGPKKSSTPVNGRRATGTSSSPRPSTSSIIARGVPKPANGRSRASKSPFTSSDEKGFLAPPANGRKRIRSPATDSDRVAFDSDGDSAEEDDDDWESRLKRPKMSTRMDPNRKLQHSALAELAANGYNPIGKAPKIVHAADIVSIEQGDKPLFPGVDPEELVVELQYPGSLARERYVTIYAGAAAAITSQLDFYADPATPGFRFQKPGTSLTFSKTSQKSYNMFKNHFSRLRKQRSMDLKTSFDSWSATRTPRY